MQTIRILVHASGSATDAHLKEAIPQAIVLAKRRNLTVEPVDQLSEIKERLLLPSRDPWAGDAALSAASTVRILSGLVRHLNPVMVRHPQSGEVTALNQPLAAILPTAKNGHHFVLSDAGAYLNLTGHQIAAGAVLCGSFWRVVYGKEHPRYGVLNHGEEVGKLPNDAREAYDYLKATRGRIVKVVEPKDILAGNSAEVLVVRNGEIGNLFLKTAEATLSAFGVVLREEIRARLQTKIGGMLAKSAFHQTKQRFYHEEVHGAFFLGINKPVMKHHGRMGAEELFLAIERLALYAAKDVIPRTRVDFLEQLSVHHPDWLPY